MTTNLSKTKPTWLAIVFNSENETSQSKAESLLGSPAPQRKQSHPIFVGLPLEQVAPSQNEMPSAPVARSLFIPRGCTLGISAADWQAAQSTDGFKLIKPKVDAGVIEVFEPTLCDDLEPGYRHFEESVALKLIAASLHEDWIHRWLLGENRKAVLVAGEAQRTELIRVKEVLRAG